MNKQSVVLWISLLAGNFGVFSIPGPPSVPRVSVSIPALHLEAGERIVGFSLQITSARVAQIPKAPIGWNLSIDNDPSWNTSVSASIIVGAAAVAPTFFRDFLVVEKAKDADMPFQIEGEVQVSRDFEHVRIIKIAMKDLLLKPQRGSDQAD